MEAETMEECCLLDEPHSSLSSLLYTTQDHLPRLSTTHSGVRPPTSIISQENVPQMAYGHS